MKTFNRVFTVIVFLFLYIPMIVLAVASFNAGTDIAVWKGFTFAQYGALFRDGVLLPLLANSVIVAVIASLVATVLGTMAAIGIRAMSGRMRRITMAVTNIPLTNPEIVTGVSLALLFAFAGQMMKLNNVSMASAASAYQAVVGFVIVLTFNGIVRKVSRENAMF